MTRLCGAIRNGDLTGECRYGGATGSSISCPPLTMASTPQFSALHCTVQLQCTVRRSLMQSANGVATQGQETRCCTYNQSISRNIYGLFCCQCNASSLCEAHEWSQAECMQITSTLVKACRWTTPIRNNMNHSIPSVQPNHHRPFALHAIYRPDVVISNRCVCFQWSLDWLGLVPECFPASS